MYFFLRVKSLDSSDSSSTKTQHMSHLVEGAAHVKSREEEEEQEEEEEENKKKKKKKKRRFMLLKGRKKRKHTYIAKMQPPLRWNKSRDHL